MSEHKSPIPSRIYNAAVGGHICGTEDIIDDDKNKTQKQINSEVEESLGTGGSVDSRIASAVATEANRAQAAEENLRQLYNSLSQNQPIPVTELPSTGEAGKIYRLAGTTSYADYMYAEGALTTPIKMAEYDNAIDDEPTVGSDNLVKSGGVAKILAGKNLLDNSKKTLGSVYLSDGSIQTGSGSDWAMSDYIAIEPDTDYYLSAKGDVSVGYMRYYHCFFDSSKQTLSLVASNSKLIHTPQDAKFIRLSYSVYMEYTEHQFEKGNRRTEYVPFKANSGIDEIRDSLVSINDAVSNNSSNINLIKENIKLSSLLDSSVAVSAFFQTTRDSDGVTFTRIGSTANTEGAGFYLGDSCENGEYYEITSIASSTGAGQINFYFCSDYRDVANTRTPVVPIAVASNAKKQVQRFVFRFDSETPYICTYRPFMTDGETVTLHILSLVKTYNFLRDANPWLGKIIATYGDSISAQGDSTDVDFPYTTASWQAQVGNRLEILRMYNRGVGNQRFKWLDRGFSTCWATKDGYVDTMWRRDGIPLEDFDAAVAAGTTSYPDGLSKEMEQSGEIVRYRGAFCSWSRITASFPESIKDNIDGILIMGSTNDPIDDTDFAFIPGDTTDPEWANSEFYSSYNGDYNINTVKGAIASTVMKMQAWIPNARIILMTPCSSEGNDRNKNFSLISNTFYKSEYIRYMGRVMSIPIIDVNATVGINGFNRDIMLADTTHPTNGNGRKRMATCIAAGLLNVWPYLDDKVENRVQ